MRVYRSMRRAVAAAGLTTVQIALVPTIRAQGGAAAASAPAATAAPTVCGSTPNCAEATDFAAMITNFRTSDARGYKILDVIVRFRNKTANPLVLGYLQGSGTAVDEKGNRYTVYGANGVRGMGQVAGNSFDPKFTLPAGGIGDAQFELAWYPGQQIYGFTFMLDLTVDEINSYEGNQHSLGGEFPLHFEGLTNGVASGAALAAGTVPSALPCSSQGAAGTAMAVAGATGSGVVQNAAGQAGSTVAAATSTVSNITSLFKHKKAPQPSAAPGADPCASATPAAGTQPATIRTAGAVGAPSATTTPGPVVATASAGGSIASKNPAATAGRPVPTPVKATPGAATTPAVGAPAANGTAKTMPGPSPTVARTQPVTTPPVATPRTVTTVRAGAAPTAAKKDTTHSVKPAKP